MGIRAKTYINDLVSVDSIVTVYYLNMTGGGTSGDSHDFWEFQYIDKGAYNIMVDGKRFDLTEGQFIMFPPNARHYGTGEKYDAQIGIVSFESSSPVLFENHSKVITLSKTEKELLSQIITGGVDIFIPASPESGLVGLIPHKDTPPAELSKLKHRLEMLLTEVCINSEDNKATSLGTNKSNYVKTQFKEIEDFLKLNLDKNLTLDDICSEFSISASKIKLLFKEECDLSPIAYFTSLKIKKAKQLIRESSLNFTQISESLGFTYVHYFSKVFKEKTGMTPTEYAKSIYKK